MKKGFTLVELLAVIVILGIIITITVPLISNIINNTKKAALEIQKKVILEAAQKYVVLNNSEMQSAGGSINITLQDLIDAHLLKSGVKDVMTNEIIDPSTEVVMIINEGDGKYIYEYIDRADNFFTFDGTNRINIKAQVPPDENMFNNTQFVFECEIKLQNTSGIRTVYSDTANDQFTYNRIHIQNNKLVISFVNQSTSEFSLTSTQTITENEWVKIKVVRNGFDFTIFINDVQDVTGTWNKGTWSYAPIDSNSATTSSLGVTYFSWNFMAPFIGMIKNVNLLM